MCRRLCDKPVPNTCCCIFHALYGSQSTSEQIKTLDFFKKVSLGTERGQTLLNAPETPHYANASHSLQEQFSDRTSHKPHLPCPDTPQQQSRGESTNTAALPPRTSAKYSSSQCLERTSKHPYLLRQVKSSVSKTLLWQSHSPDCWPIGPSLGQAETRGQTLYFCISPRLSKLSSKH